MTNPIASSDGSRDFDFFLGHWRAKNRRLAERLQGSTVWTTFEANHHCVPLLDGVGNMDELRADEQGALGMSIRFFNKSTKLWSIWWVSSRDGILQPPVTGSFKNGRGVFEGPDELAGRPILVRYVWSEITPNSARWHQEFSADNGALWETNWVMDFSRVGT